MYRYGKEGVSKWCILRRRIAPKYYRCKRNTYFQVYYSLEDKLLIVAAAAAAVAAVGYCKSPNRQVVPYLISINLGCFT